MQRQRTAVRLFGRIEELRDTEVEQLHLPVVRHQDVGRLEVPVHDEIAVRVLDGLGHHEKELQAPGERQPVSVAVAVNRFALDQLHREERAAVIRRAAVEQLGDGWMIERGEDRSLLPEASEDGI